MYLRQRQEIQTLLRGIVKIAPIDGKNYNFGREGAGCYEPVTSI